MPIDDDPRQEKSEIDDQLADDLEFTRRAEELVSRLHQRRSTPLSGPVAEIPEDPEKT